ncbi:hypothetical protein GCM10025876_25750 [Demequina litorisediminis]|uniref:Teichoic acid poly(glycerol phosphate) polymerase n=1 Tax=Demequina litorisediminis TaxID=1849022 RepID=A0ABQ6IF65_9MICO|nr:hypothetical protein GCM10025876_25750 [Demequina litorisediminis]
MASNSYSAEVWKHSYPVRCEMLEVGYPRNDVLVSAGAAQTQAAREVLGISPEARVFLYAPTFRDGGMGAAAGLDLRALQEYLAPDDVFLVRGHYFHGRQASIPGQGQIVDVSDHPSVEDLYLAADVLITDYSSVMFDYANLRRPMVIFPYDWEPVFTGARHVLRHHGGRSRRGGLDHGGTGRPHRLGRLCLGGEPGAPGALRGDLH